MKWLLLKTLIVQTLLLFGLEQARGAVRLNRPLYEWEALIECLVPVLDGAPGGGFHHAHVDISHVVGVLL